MCKRVVYVWAVVMLGLALANPVLGADPDLLAWWSCDEGSGSVVGDVSGNGRDGIFVNGDPAWAEGIHGGAVQLADPTLIEVPPFNVELTQATMAGWIKPDGAQPDWSSFVMTRTPGLATGFNILGLQLAYHWNDDSASWSYRGGDMIPDGEWTFCAVTVEPDKATFYVNGVAGSVNTVPHGPCTWNSNVYLGGDGTYASGRKVTGALLDDVSVFSRALTADEIMATMNGLGAYPAAAGPDPKDGAMLEATWVTLRWRAGDFAVSHDVYLGDNFDDVDNGTGDTFQGNQTDTTLIAGFFGFPLPDGLVPGTTYYWRIDEVDDADPNSPWRGDVWSFWVPPITAYNASPADGVQFVSTDVTLSWTPGFNAKLHTAYLGDDFDTVDNATGGLAQTGTTFVPGTLEVDKTYYWRVDEFDPPATHKGEVWSFTTVPDVAVTNPNLTLWWTLDEGQGTTAVDWSGHGNHGALNGEAQWVDGYQGTALTFGADDYVEAAGYPGITGTAARTLCAWIRTTQANRTIMSWGQNTASMKWRMRSDATGGLRVEVNGGYNYGATNIADGRWHHVAVTFEDDGTPDVLDTLLYVDGQPEATAASLDEPVDTDATGAVRIGKSPYHTAGFIGAIDDARIYDKVLTAEEIQQVMLGDTKLAGSPVPNRDAVVDIRDISSLSWSAGDGAASHDVYFGTDRDTLESKGNQAGTSLSLADLVEFGGGDYYWRIDEVAADGTVTAGTTWKFTVPDSLIVEDFESYNDLAEDDPASNRIYLAWIDGFGTTTNGAVAGNLDVPLMAPGRDSAQAMPVSYDNAGKTSEATRTLTSGKDWTEQGVTKLVIWFSGDAANAADRMFVALGNAIVYHPDDAATQDAGWNEWVIDLQEFANQGADLTNVGSITVGFGTRNAPVATGGTGTVVFDDIGLHHQ